MLEVCNWEDESDEERNYLTEDFYDFLFEVREEFSDTIDECIWMGRNCMTDVKTMFSPIVTKDGLCFSFNSLDRSDIFTEIVARNYYESFQTVHQSSTNWSLDIGFDENFADNEMPRRTSVGGVNGGLLLTFKSKSKNFDYFCSDALEGYKVTLHNPTQVPLVSHDYFRVGLNQVATVSVKPVVVKTSNQLKRYRPTQRKCYFSEERQLLFFKMYDQDNCFQECIANFTFHYCGCVSFDLPRVNSTPICGHGKRKCVQKSLELLVSLEFSNLHNDSIDVINKCDCIQTCSFLGFEAEVSQIDWKWRRRAKAWSVDEYEHNPEKEYTRLQIFFKNSQFITSERNELYGLMDFLASCGGLLGLFIGFSLFSCIEIVYFLTLRFFCNYRFFGHSNWAGDYIKQT
ncbi:hypothetical protein FQA39_LY18445 [Lamprigera yunnana]|nr:hypothetical protein FQA39_LY18445 [Lamprigera yunnana]